MKQELFNKKKINQAIKAIEEFEDEIFGKGDTQGKIDKINMPKDKIDNIHMLYFEYNNFFKDKNDNFNENAQNKLNKPALKIYGHLAYYTARIEIPNLESSKSINKISKYNLIKDLYLESIEAYDRCKSNIDIKQVNNDIKSLKEQHPKLEAESKKNTKQDKELAR